LLDRPQEIGRSGNNFTDWTKILQSIPPCWFRVPAALQAFAFRRLLIR
jgi:hypothetical protein